MKTSLQLFAVLTLTLLLPVHALAIPILGEDSAPFDPFVPIETDVDSVRILIDPEFMDSTVQAGVPFTFGIITENLAYQPESATSLPGNYADGTRASNEGHLHAYASIIDGTFKETNAFLGAPAFTEIADGVLTATMTLEEAGNYWIYVESQYDDHTSRIRNHPQQIGAWDVSRVTAVSLIPEAPTLGFLAMSSILLLFFRPGAIS